jgi:valine--pyruvate aminotransferase
MNATPTPALSAWGDALAQGTGIETLMDDLGRALASGSNLRMLGGGNPALIPEVCAAWRDRLRALLDDPAAADRMLGIYDPPSGNPRFIQACARLLSRHLAREVDPAEIAVTAGGQAAFFALFNLLAGPDARGRRRHILLPIVPEYIGYADQGVHPGTFRAVAPTVTRTGPARFRYGVDWDRCTVDDDTAAICVSRPTNPSGNLLSEADLARLAGLAAPRGIPLIIDNAYGLPFPGVVYGDARLFDAPGVVQVFSLSKLGLPGTRNAIVLAPPELARRVTSVVAVSGLANPNPGQAIATPLLEDGTIERLVRDAVRPYYLARRNLALAAFDSAFAGVPHALHESDGAMFLWAHFPALRIPSRELYTRLKARGVIAVPGEPFFFGLASPDDLAPHRHQCLRISYAMPEDTVRAGIELIADEVRRACYFPIITP